MTGTPLRHRQQLENLPMPIELRPARPPSVLTLLAGNPSALHACAMTAWILLLAFGAMCTFALLGVWSSLRSVWQPLPHRAPRRAAAPQHPRWG